MGRVIPAIRDMAKIEKAAASPSEMVFLLSLALTEIEDTVNFFKNHGKRVFVHVDLTKGLKADRYSIDFIKHKTKADGIISTHVPILKIAKKQGLEVVHRIFLVDSSAFENGLDQAKDLSPSYLEIMPGVLMPEIIEEVVKRFNGPVIAGGLVSTYEQVQKILSAGAYAVSTSKEELWDMEG